MKRKKHYAKQIILLVLYLIYFIVLFKITIFRDTNTGSRNVNLVPFSTINGYMNSVRRGITITGAANLLGNLIMFFPLGYMSASLFPKMRKLTRIFILAFIFSVSIEIFQYILACGATDIDDVILNVIGGVIGYWIYALIKSFFKSEKFVISISALMIVSMYIGFFALDNVRFLADFHAPSILPERSETLEESNREPITIDEPDESPAAHLTADSGNNTDANTSDVKSTTNEEAWYLILVNKRNYIPADYEVELTKLTNGQSVDKRIVPALQQMLDDARSEGVYPVVVSGYRSAAKQQSLLDEKIEEYRSEGFSAKEASTKAKEWVAIPEASEHQLGIAVDINADGIKSAGYEVYDWLGENAYKYGFILRYPSDKTDITEVIYEPWHYRYVGVEAAADISKQGVCLEEYLDSAQ